ncbi:DUF3958 family protein [Streptococcus oricebi]|uniref:Uncharacterized protein n=1 Tax=Streptococcus oricebi TaxID=1547447 RepID=A0ABS5B4N3_9STRE|nr:DUF3958 family protein [Streptococcus oricebi]MBP2623798.1 hypothetical protein [Streptococcus oricebi]
MNQKEKRLDLLHQKERDLLEREEELRQDRQQMMAAEEDYFYHEGAVANFLKELSYKYQEPAYLFERLDTEFFHESSKISSSFEEDLESLKNQERKIGRSLEDLAEERLRLNQEGGRGLW